MSNQHSVYHEFHLQPSRLKWVIHIVAWLILQILLYQLLISQWYFIAVLISVICSVFFIYQQPNIIYLGHLDGNEWTLVEQSKQKNITHRVNIVNMIDHLLYIIVFFDDDTEYSSIVIWQDQLSPTAWKALKTRSKYKQF